MKRLVGFLFILLALSTALVFSIWLWLPTPKQIRGCMVTNMYHVHLCPGSDDYVPLKQISTYMQKTVILTEDSAFYQHHGFDWGAIEKDAREGWEKGKFKRGGSTITQQLAKNMFLSKDRTFIRKGFEALITEEIEKTLKKNEILERYLNVVEFGPGIYGIKKAAAFYFKKTPAQLDVVESAFLAMVLPNPKNYSRSYFKQQLTPFARRRIRQIVDGMYRYNRITSDDYTVAVEKINGFFNPAPPPETDTVESATPPPEGFDVLDAPGDDDE